MSPGQMKHMEEVQKERAENRSKRLDASLLVPKVPTPRALRYTEGETGISVYDPDKGTSTFQRYPTGFVPKKPAAGDDTDKAKSAGITKIIAGAGRVLDAAREEAKAAQAQLDRLDRSKPDETRMTTEDFDKAIAAWQVKVAAAEKRSDDAQAKVGRMTPVYNLAATTNDTTGIGEAYRDRPPAPPSTRSFDLFSPTAPDKKFGTAFGPPTATPKPAPRTPSNTKEDALTKQASAMVQQWVQSGAPKEEINAAVSKINNRLADEIRALRSGGK
jgi:hypothetical protein